MFFHFKKFKMKTFENLPLTNTDKMFSIQNGTARNNTVTFAY